MAVFAVNRILRRSDTHIDVDRSRYPVIGVDLSAHNGSVDFDSVGAAGVAFAYIKASEGVSFRDSAFARNARSAHAAGLAVGAYHFFRFECDGSGQARNLMAAVDSLPVTLPLAIDIEEWGNRVAVPTDTIVARLQTMESELRAAGFRVIIYTNKNGYHRFYRSAFATETAPPLWICSFTDPPLDAPWTLWQHSHSSHIPGIPGHTDLNTFNGTPEAFATWASPQ